MSWLDDLERELETVGIRGRLRRRIVAELDDHLRCEPESEAVLGSPGDIARRFADELGTDKARRASAVAFAALALAGVLFAVVFLTKALSGSAPDLFAGTVPGAALVLQPVIVLGPQFAFVAGALGAWRAFRLRGSNVLPASEVGVLNRRTALGLAAATAAFVAVGLYALDFRNELPVWWMSTALALSGVSVCVLVLASAPLLATIRLRPAASGEAGDLYADLPFLSSIPPWRLAGLLAAGLGLLVTTVAAIQRDPFDGLAGGIAEAAAVLIGFAALGRPLGLRAPSRR